MANRIKGITVEIGGDTTKLSKACGYSVPIGFVSVVVCSTILIMT